MSLFIVWALIQELKSLLWTKFSPRWHCSQSAIGEASPGIPAFTARNHARHSCSLRVPNKSRPTFTGWPFFLAVPQPIILRKLSKKSSD
jgi:hypothetical protein